MSININKVYTRGGDSGKTALIGGQRVRKDDAAVECYGTLDELNAVIGMARAELDDAWMDELLARVQNELFDLGNELATPPGCEWEGMPRASEEAVARLEVACDEANAELSTLKSFVLPAGERATATLHLARTVCRRAERRMVSFAEQRELSGPALAYVNRLSDLLFVLSRRAARGEEVLWTGGFARPGGAAD